MLNKAQLIGNLGRDPEIRYLPSGDAVASFSVATTERWKDKNTGEKMEHTEWHRVTAFGRLAEIIGQYLIKGSLVFVSGKIKTNKYTDNAGVEKYSTEIVIDEMKMLSGNKGDGQGGQQQAPQHQQSQRQAPQGNGRSQSYGSAGQQGSGRGQQQGGQQRQAPPQRQAPARPASGFDDMEDDLIPF